MLIAMHTVITGDNIVKESRTEESLDQSSMNKFDVKKTVIEKWTENPIFLRSKRISSNEYIQISNLMNKNSQNLPSVRSLKRINWKNETMESLLVDLNKTSQSDFFLNQKTIRPH